MIMPKVERSNHDVETHYDELDQFYRNLWGDHLHHGLWYTGKESVEEAVEQLIDYLAVRTGIEEDDYVCDVGSGYGATARHLVRYHKAKVVGVTLSQAQYSYASSTNSDNSKNPVYLRQDWSKNKFSSQTFDRVVAIESIAHMVNKADFFREAYRVLRPGGCLGACAWLAAETPSDVHVRYLLEPICQESCLPGLGTSREYLDELEAAGFELKECEDLSRVVQRTWSICTSRLLVKLLSDTRYHRYLLNNRRKNRRFLLTPLRMWLAYKAGAIRYGMFVARKP